MTQQHIQNPPPNYSQKTHTFTHSPSVHQIMAYAIIVSEIAVYTVCIHMNLHSWTLTAIFITTSVLMIIIAVISSLSDPTDRVIYRYKWSQYDSRIKFNNSDFLDYYCDYCDSFCSQDSKHCRTCNRCVYHFDHHCIWINNCIGQQNYKWFFLLIICTFLQIATFLAAGSLYTVSIITTETNFAQHLRYLIPVWIMMFVLGMLWIALIHLITMHIYLWCQGLTTYEYLKGITKQQKQAQVPPLHKSSKQNKKNVQIMNHESNANIKMCERMDADSIARQSLSRESQSKMMPKNRAQVAPEYQRYNGEVSSDMNIENTINASHRQLNEDEDNGYRSVNNRQKYIYGAINVSKPKRSDKNIRKIQ